MQINENILQLLIENIRQFGFQESIRRRTNTTVNVNVAVTLYSCHTDGRHVIRIQLKVSGSGFVGRMLQSGSTALSPAFVQILGSDQARFYNRGW